MEKAWASRGLDRSLPSVPWVLQQGALNRQPTGVRWGAGESFGDWGNREPRPALRGGLMSAPSCCCQEGKGLGFQSFWLFRRRKSRCVHRMPRI